MTFITQHPFQVWFRSKFGTNATDLSPVQRQWRIELRSAALRWMVLLILIFNLLVGEHNGKFSIHSNVITGYALATGLALILVMTDKAPRWAGTAFIVVDAALVVALFHEHVFGPVGTIDHSITNASLAVAFLLLNHVALRLVPHLVVLFTVLVVSGWLSLLIVTTLKHSGAEHSAWPLLKDVALAASFSFSAFVALLLTRDHNKILKRATKSERRRQNLSRFFSPGVVAEIQGGRASLKLQRRHAAVMFIDLRSFTSFAETANPDELGELLADYRAQVTRAVFASGGIVDKFIGDGVMAVYGPPVPHHDDTKRALECALVLARELTNWQRVRHQQGKSSLKAGIGLHVGPVISGVLKSGQHDEFTVFGDAVNVAERLERLTKSLGADLVVSAAVLEHVGQINPSDAWILKDNVALEGRSGTLSIAYLTSAPTTCI